MAQLPEEKNDTKATKRTMAGFVMKESKHLKKRRPRWLTLSADGCLRSYKSNKNSDLSNTPTETIPLHEFKFVLCTNHAVQHFTLISADLQRQRVFELELENAAEWVAAILHHNQRLVRIYHRSEIISIQVTIFNPAMMSSRKDNHIVVHSVYRQDQKVQPIFDELLSHVQRQHYPMKFVLEAVYAQHSKIYGSQIQIDAKRVLTDYPRENTSSDALWQWTAVVAAKYEHKITNNSITCKHMVQKQTNNPLLCPVYFAMTCESKYSEEHLTHLIEYEHFANEYEAKPRCKYGDASKAYKRQERGMGGDQLEDRCHMKLYRHPPRTRNIKLSENIHSLVLKKNIFDIASYIAEPKDSNSKILSMLIAEVIRNGFKSDLCLECGAGDDCKHDEHSIMKIVDSKMKHLRHKQMGSPLSKCHMLALVLYTACECNYDLCASQRNGDYHKWEWFDYCLFTAIKLLSERENGSFMVWSGLNAVKLDKRRVDRGYFATYVSTSWNPDVAASFIAGNDGMMIQFDASCRSGEGVFCCDVSWISKFKDECEVLWARSASYGLLSMPEPFQYNVVNEANGIQTVSLKLAMTSAK